MCMLVIKKMPFAGKVLITLHEVLTCGCVRIVSVMREIFIVAKSVLNRKMNRNMKYASYAQHTSVSGLRVSIYLKKGNFVLLHNCNGARGSVAG
jgi:hypothetical protein